MAFSRAADAAQKTGQASNSTGVQTQVGTTTGTSTTTGKSSSSATSTERKQADYLDPVARKALNDLLITLSGGSGGGNNPLRPGGGKGGNSEIANNAKRITQERFKEVATNQGLRSDYSKGAAFADATGAMNAQLAEALQLAMPTITAGIDSAGTSGSALSALLTQQAADDAAAQAAKLGLEAAINYGNIQVGFSGVIEGLLGQGSEEANLLLQALGIAKGASENSKTTSSSNQSSSSSQTTNSSQTSTSTSTSKDSQAVTPTTPTKKQPWVDSGYGMLGDPVVNGANTPTRGTATSSYSQFLK